jgi:hypothetical protein
MPDALRPPKVVARAVSAAAQIDIAHGSDWNDSFQVIEGGIAWDLTGAVVELVIRPAYDDTILLALLSSVTGDILIGDAATGKVQIYRPGWWVTTLPAGAWAFVLRVLKDGEAREIARGPMIVHPSGWLS